MVSHQAIPLFLLTSSGPAKPMSHSLLAGKRLMRINDTPIGDNDALSSTSPEVSRQPLFGHVPKWNLFGLQCGSGTQPRMMLKSHSEDETIRQLGFCIHELTSPLEGTLVKGRLISSGSWSDFYRGLWIRPNAEPVPVAIEQIRRVYLNGEDKHASETTFETVFRSFSLHSANPSILTGRT